MTEIHGGKDGKRTDALLDHLSFYQDKVRYTLELIDQFEAAAPSGKNGFDQLRAELERKPVVH